MPFHNSFVTLALSINTIVSEPSVALNRHHNNAPSSPVASADTVISKSVNAVTTLSVKPRLDSGNSDSTVALIHLHDIIPAGWRRIDTFQLNDLPGPPTMWLIGRYEHLPIGSTFVMLADDPIPPGWELTQPSSSAHAYQKTIVRRR